MRAKLFEVRNRCMFIPALAVKLEPANKAEHYLLSRAGYGSNPKSQGKYVMLATIDGGDGKITFDPLDDNTVGASAHH